MLVALVVAAAEMVQCLSLSAKKSAGQDNRGSRLARRRRERSRVDGAKQEESRIDADEAHKEARDWC